MQLARPETTDAFERFHSTLQPTPFRTTAITTLIMKTHESHTVSPHLTLHDQAGGFTLGGSSYARPHGRTDHLFSFMAWMNGAGHTAYIPQWKGNACFSYQCIFNGTGIRLRHRRIAWGEAGRAILFNTSSSMLPCILAFITQSGNVQQQLVRTYIRR